jgi:hypothetical protein
MPGYRWQINTPLGEFRLEVVQVGGRFPSAQERERVQRVWFFAQRELHSLSPVALETARELCAELGSTRDWRTSGRMEPLAAQSLAGHLELALLSGRLVLKQVPRIHAWGGAHEAKASSEAQWTPRPSAREERTSEGAWLELELLNQQGEPVANRRFRVIQHERVVREGMTNANGFARVESLSPGTCDIEFVDFDESDFNHQPALPGAAPAASSGPVTSLAT